MDPIPPPPPPYIPPINPPPLPPPYAKPLPSIPSLPGVTADLLPQLGAPPLAKMTPAPTMPPPTTPPPPTTTAAPTTLPWEAGLLGKWDNRFGGLVPGTTYNPLIMTTTTFGFPTTTGLRFFRTGAPTTSYFLGALAASMTGQSYMTSPATKGSTELKVMTMA